MSRKRSPQRSIENDTVPPLSIPKAKSIESSKGGSSFFVTDQLIEIFPIILSHQSKTREHRPTVAIKASPTRTSENRVLKTKRCLPGVTKIRTRERRQDGTTSKEMNRRDSLDSEIFPANITIGTFSTSTGVATENVGFVLFIPVYCTKRTRRWRIGLSIAFSLP